MAREYIESEDLLNTGRKKLNRSIDKSYDAEETSVQALKDANTKGDKAIADANKLGNEAKQISTEKGNESIAIAKENEKVAGEANLIAKDTNDRMNQIIAGTTDSAEVIDSRKPVGLEAAETLGERLNLQFGKNSDFRPEELSVISKMKKEFFDRGLNVKWFGAVGDGVTDDTNAIKSAIEHAKNLKKDIHITFPHGDYLITEPIVVYSFEASVDVEDQWWFGHAITLRGYNKSVVRIIKKGDKKLEASDVDNVSEYVGIDTVFLVAKLKSDGTISNETATGVSIQNMTIKNESENTDSYSIFGKASQRGTFKELNIWSNKGIILDNTFSTIFKSIVFYCKNTALRVINGTSNNLDMLYTYNCKNPYKVHSSYTRIGTMYADSCTGVVFDIGGYGMIAENLGTESEKADTIIKISRGLVVNSLYFHRQKNTEESPLKITGNISIKSIIVYETFRIEESVKSPLLTFINEAAMSSYDIGDIRYEKAFDDGNPKNNPIFILVKDVDKGSNNSMSSNLNYSGGMMSLRRGTKMPYVGYRKSIGVDLPEGMIEKAIYLDNETERRTSTGVVTWELEYNKGDVLLMNDVFASGYFAAVVDRKTDGFVNGNTFRYVPILMDGTTENRPKNPKPSMMYFDQNLGYPIWWNGANWVSATGKIV